MYTDRKNKTLKPYTKASYAIYQISKDTTEEPKYEISQKVANLLSGLNETEPSHPTKSAIDFLTETLEGYNNFKKLKRAKKLEKQANLSTDEKNLLNKLHKDNDIGQFLNSKQASKPKQPKKIASKKRKKKSRRK